jgi:hypothetical protein
MYFHGLIITLSIIAIIRIPLNFQLAHMIRFLGNTASKNGRRKLVKTA